MRHNSATMQRSAEALKMNTVIITLCIYLLQVGSNIIHADPNTKLINSEELSENVLSSPSTATKATGSPLLTVTSNLLNSDVDLNALKELNSSHVSLDHVEPSPVTTQTDDSNSSNRVMATWPHTQIFTTTKETQIMKETTAVPKEGFTTLGVYNVIMAPSKPTLNLDLPPKQSEVRVQPDLEINLAPSRAGSNTSTFSEVGKHSKEDQNKGFKIKVKSKSNLVKKAMGKQTKVTSVNKGKEMTKKKKINAKAKLVKTKISNNEETPHFPYFKDNYCPPECACYGKVVQCSDKGIHKIPYGIPYNARYVLLMNNKIDFIQLDLLNEYLSLEFLVLSNNRLTDEAIEGAFEGIEKLTRLFLDDNFLTSIPADLPPSLEELRLNHNNISIMSEKAWSRCQNLKIISLNNNSLTNDSVLAGVFGSLSRLRTLSINYNHLAKVPEKLPTNLKELYAEGNQISVISDQIFPNISDLLFLDLSSNKLKNKGINKHSFRHMINLENLNLEKNLLHSVPKHLPKSLKTLILKGNKIVSVSKDAFLKMTNLEQLGLSHNKIFKVAPSAFKGLSALHHLDISYNYLAEVPHCLPMTMNSIALNNNLIAKVPRDSFCNMKHVQSSLILINLQYNNIDMRNIDIKAFRCLRGYQVVHFY
ncbi:podocan [Erpetoichthys calabaricus]|uniref:podocan n=1 Tax=Erpetoichthys calabaricus TaxID=27687 RepID=UPI0022346DAD|nr:podocan [Erpetoichthys calabaricus]